MLAALKLKIRYQFIKKSKDEEMRILGVNPFQNLRKREFQVFSFATTFVVGLNKYKNY